MRRLALAAALIGAVALAAPAAAQFPTGYKFLEAVKKKDGQAVTDALNQPGSTVVNTKDATSGDTALHLVVARRDVTWIKFLASRGANVNVRNTKGETPLQLASNIGFIEGIEALVELGARIDEPNSTGETPLIAAVHRRDGAMARVLLKAGADYKRSDSSGRNALDYATLDGRGNPVLAEIEAAMKKPSTAKSATYGPKF